MRIHGSALFTLDAGAVDERVTIAYGIIRVTDVQNVASEVPRAFTDAGAPWIVHGYVHLSSGAEAAINSERLVWGVEIDSKSMRKVKATDNLMFACEVADSVDQTGTFDFAVAVRVLFAS